MALNKTLVFDIDGTLAETAGDLIGALNVVLHGEEIAPLPVEAARSLLGAGGRALIQRGFARAGKSIAAEKLDAMFVDFLKFYNAHIADHTFLYPGVAAAIDRFLEAGWRLAVCTNKMDRSSHLLLEKLGIEEKFAVICGQDTFGVGKPDPKPLIETIRAAGGALKLAVMVGDLITDVRIARAAGVPVVLVDFGYTDTPAAELGADRVISHFDELYEAALALTKPTRAH